MKRTLRRNLWLPLVSMLVLAAPAAGQGVAQPQRDVFKGKLFAPNVIMEHQQALDLTKEQFTAIRAAVVEVQAAVAEHEWDLREAYQRVLDDLDAAPVDEDRVLANVEAALQAENEVKKLQVAMLIRLRNLLTDEQMAYLQSLQRTR